MMEEIHAAGERLVARRRKLAARDGKPGYEKNCEMIKAEITRLEGTTFRVVGDSDGDDGA